jgi:radical SAM superfamily enzyme YgiQ (UPF0313 family)
VLVGFQDQTNLGLGYLAAVLRQRQFEVGVLDFRQGFDHILEVVRASDPLLVGFSLIFQYYLPQFAKLVAYLRDNGIECHFSVGGHYPSLRYAVVLEQIPQLDSVVRCEGEMTLAELMDSLDNGRDWRQLPGLAYRQDHECRATEARALIGDLDSLPYPVLPEEDQMALGKRAMPMVASRGCARNCAFCSIRQFYAQVPGKKVRVRKPVKVAEQMRVCHQQRGTSIFLFQDDDFPVWGAFGRRWIDEFTQALDREGLIGRMLWKISCRADEIDPELFAQMRAAGLYAVYLGLESGNPEGLRTLNKGLSVEQNLRAVSLLKELELLVGYGFMMFDPSSTFETVRTNVAFLREITGDGTTAAVFGRMQPYAGTPIEAELAASGRLRGGLTDPDYAFLDPRLDEFFPVVNAATEDWIHRAGALSVQFNWAWQEWWMLRRLFPPLPGLDAYARTLRSLTGRGNEYLLRLVDDTAQAFADGSRDTLDLAEISAARQRFARELLTRRDAFILRHQARLRAALGSAVQTAA